jgi:hypothetical protein
MALSNTILSSAGAEGLADMLLQAPGRADRGTVIALNALLQVIVRDFIHSFYSFNNEKTKGEDVEFACFHRRTCPYMLQTMFGTPLFPFRAILLKN